MKMLNWIIEKARTQGADQEKAHQHLSKSAKENFRNIMRGYDAFVQHMEKVSDPSILIGTAKDSLSNNVLVRIPTNAIHRNLLITGATGSGKTSFATSIFCQAVGQNYPIAVADFKSGFFGIALRWAAANAYRLNSARRQQFIQSLAVVNPFGEELVPLNVCKVIPGSTPETQAYDVCLALSRLFSGDVGFQMQNILHHLLLLLTEARLTLVEAPFIMRDELLRDILAKRSINPSVKEFFLRDYPSVPSASKLALLTRIQNLLLAENIKLMLGADDLIDITAILDKGHPLFMFLGKGPGIPEEQMDLVASLTLQLLFQATFNTESGKRRPYQIILDEFFHVLDAPALEKRFETALSTVRAFGLSIALVMHNFAQISPNLRDSILNNCDYMAIFRTHSHNAQYFGDFLPELDPEIVAEALNKTGSAPSRHEIAAQLINRLQQLPNRQCYFYDKQKPYKAVLVHVPDIPTPERALGISEKALDDFIRKERVFLGGYAVPREELRRQIEARRARREALIRPPAVQLSSEPPCGGDSARISGAKAADGRRRKPKLG
jgi:hypothetical protein